MLRARPFKLCTCLTNNNLTAAMPEPGPPALRPLQSRPVSSIAPFAAYTRPRWNDAGVKRNWP
jgi:hypothetical protein